MVLNLYLTQLGLPRTTDPGTVDSLSTGIRQIIIPKSMLYLQELNKQTACLISV